MTKPTLDYLAAKTAHQITQVIGTEVKKQNKVAPKDVEILVTKALGVLQSQGVYAMALFLFSRSGKESEESNMSAEERTATQILSWLWPLRNPQNALKDLQTNNNQPQTDKNSNQVNSDKNNMLREWANISSNLDTLLLVRDLYEQTLIYARYHAKALGGE
ncbi:MAG: hypothetical protein D6802_03025 [Ardenticatenia bacterium]|nr:MAG: hypothetical protein D6802_03025 [Ardenticatenia bacterium]